jgi:signal peptidase I
MSGSHCATALPGNGWRRVADLTREVLLTVAAAFGAICALVIVLVIVFDLGVIVFRTGSMTPTIPTGAAALVRTVPASEVRVGDVVTVASPLGPLPVTHRVTSVEPLGPGTVRLHLRGDANDAEDPFPYDVTEVRRVIAAAPGVGYALVRLQQPTTMAALTGLIAGLVLWALWPRSTRGDRMPARRSGRSGRSARSVAAIALLAVAVVVLPTPGPASAAPSPAPPAMPPRNGYSVGDDVLRVTSSLPTDRPWPLSPGTSLTWRVTTSAQPPQGADSADGWLWVSVIAGGALVELDDAVRITLVLCDAGWDGAGGCSGGAREIRLPPVEGAIWHDREAVGRLSVDAPQDVEVRIDVTEDLPDEAQGQTMSLGLRFDAFGDSAVIDEVAAELPGGTTTATGTTGGGVGSPGLATTGADLRPGAWAVLAVLLGAVLLDRSRARRHRSLRVGGARS